LAWRRERELSEKDGEYEREREEKIEMRGKNNRLKNAQERERNRGE